jgi:hypothetical protein
MVEEHLLNPVQDISDAALGRMVVEAVEAAYDPAAGEVAVFRFLALLYRSTREHERRAADSLLARAMRATGSLEIAEDIG